MKIAKIFAIALLFAAPVMIGCDPAGQTSVVEVEEQTDAEREQQDLDYEAQMQKDQASQEGQ
ncbi:MAG: hypothetical protein AAFP90_03490 [Planctomycetota bacterium]